MFPIVWKLTKCYYVKSGCKRKKKKEIWQAKYYQLNLKEGLDGRIGSEKPV